MIDRKLRTLGIAPAGSPQFVPMSDLELRTIEQELGARLPQGLRDLLTMFGASRFPDGARVETRDQLPERVSRDGHTASVEDFYGAAESGLARGLAWGIKAFAGRMPATVIPMARSAMGDQILIGIAGSEAGKVFYWFLGNEPPDEEEYLEDHGEPMPPAEWFRNLTLIAESFEDFVDRISVVRD